MHSVIVVSAGTGSRYTKSGLNNNGYKGGGASTSPVPKTPNSLTTLKTLEPLPFLKDGGGETLRMPAFLHSLLLFAGEEFSEIILVVSPEELEKGRQGIAGSFAEELKAWGKIHPPIVALAQKLTLVAGGKERYHSVANGLQCVSKKLNSDSKSDYVWIHDAARPLLHPDDIRLLMNTVNELCHAHADANQGTTSLGDTGVLPVQLSTHSIKAVNETGMVTQNIPRHTLREASTPQIFPTRRLAEIYTKLLSSPADKASQNTTIIPTIPTDDSELYFTAGYPVRTVTLNHPNPKLTVASDHAYMCELLKGRRG